MTTKRYCDFCNSLNPEQEILIRELSTLNVIKYKDICLSCAKRLFEDDEDAKND